MDRRWKYGIGGGLALLLVVVAALMFYPARAAMGSGSYVASSQAKPFHRLTCEWAGKIAGRNLQTYQSRDEAIAAGHRPCKLCKP